MLRQVVKLAVAALLFVPQWLSAKSIVIYHTSDVHGWYSSRPEPKNKEKPGRVIGGFAALSSLVKKEKAPVLLLDSGDWYQGTPEGNVTKGLSSVNLMNMLGYKASALGNHEYDHGPDNLRTILSSVTFTVLAANIYVEKTDKRIDYAKPYIVVESSGVKLGIIGLTTEDVPKNVIPRFVSGLIFKDKAVEAAALVKELKAQGVNAVIVITHSGLCGKCTGKTLFSSDIKLDENDLKKGNITIGRAAKGDIAVVMGGHNHTGIIDGYRDEDSGTLYVESGSTLSDTTRVELEFDDATGKFIKVSSKLLDLWVDETGEDPAVVEAIKPIEEQVSSKMGKVIGKASADMLRYDGIDSPVGRFVTDIMLKWSKTQVAFQNIHGLRADILKGDITLRGVYQVIPFDNTLVTVDLTGAQIMELLRTNISSSGNLMPFSGMRVVYSVDKGGKISKLSVKVGHKPLNEKEVYRVATNNYLLGGGSGGEVFLNAKNINDTMVNIRDIVVEEVQKRKTVSTPAPGRLVKK